ncbi:MAG: nitrous oxidase accessory protein [Sulfurimonas sp. RIFOXYD12_FULL_33_39]|uniref:nitrous oxide reductase family maturation protein NosD n=1 Tax=unclassified Sulfurimonas TaxID=2623549 RepID=UPI0008C77992|nr:MULTISPECIES: nitrous oxide reductase family maturation protein NosD [unclassified Sulfurimonas]OHE07717.1 MAG: nitrous oxidase accessory protein [Sulfurimonas sp. RIFCSPLOWO2_12_FULL_34_6]OHE10032.1 MAG: nitrous oxidase accessory protein [Sulfurimonas sp. RIFOXYD12_FULL_33_39]OHE14747.1 MAG: nitrous oxidase accessory protein [Sulfurimonas sp. RIFOXYD2_FULL_34_21]
MLRLLFALFSVSLSLLNANVLQKAIDDAPVGSILKLNAGTYEGNIVINKPITIIGKEDGVIIDGGNKGTVIAVNSSYVTLKNLKIINSGDRHETIDAAISLSDSKQCEVSNCIIDSCLFGIDLKMVQNSIISNNKITSKDFDLGLRGDGIRVWYSNDNIIKGNSLVKSRDMVIWYSHGNEISENSGEYCRYSLHFMYAGKNIVKNNHYKYNSVGIFFMYSKDTIATGNVIKSSLGATGMGIGLKEVTNFTIKDNTILYCAQGMYIDRSPFEPDTNNWIEENKILYNSEALHFHSLSENNIIKNNKIMGNIEDVVNDGRSSKTYNNEIEQNYWDNYEGFDKDGDNIGDTPHKVYQYADQLWVYNPDVKFFYGSPVISLLNFLAKLAPFTSPLFLMEDKKPKVMIKG